jgi:hypothetical protein
MMDDKRGFLRHAVATVAYRGGKAVRGAPASFAKFASGDPPKTPEQILAHIGDLFEWALSIAVGAQKWNNSTPLAWDDEVARFFDTVKRFDDYLASDAPLGSEPERLFQGAIADALTHVGQLAMLRRLAGSPIKAENYYQADIVAGRVGSEQAPARREF